MSQTIIVCLYIMLICNVALMVSCVSAWWWKK